MKSRVLFTTRISLPLATAIAGLLALQSAQAATFYWDNNGTTTGFGSAGGTWAQNNTSGGTSARWKTDVTGVAAGSATQATTDADIFNFGTATSGLGAGTITVSGSVTMGDTFYGAASGAVVLSGGTINFGAAKTITVNNAPNINTISSVIGGAATSLTKAGIGTLVLNGANTYTGTTIISGGTLNLGGGTGTGSLTSSALTLAGGSFSYTRTGTNTHSFTTTLINSTASALSVNAGNTLNLGTVSRGQGVRFDFSGVGAGTVAADTANNTNGIMSSFTLGDTWAVANGPGSAISGMPNGSYTLSSVAGTTAANYLDGNIDVDNSLGGLDASISANSLRFSSAAANTLALTGTTNALINGGILVGSGVGANLTTITGGTLAGASSKDLCIIQNNSAGGLTISSVIGDNTGATALAKSGPGLLTLYNSNTFTGGVFLHGGQLTLANAGALNSGTPNNITFSPGSTGRLTLNGNSLTIPALSSNTTNPGSPIIENASGDNATLTIGNIANANSTFVGVIQNGTGAGILALAKAGTGTLTLTGVNTYTGGTTLSAGTVNANTGSAFGGGDILVSGSSRINVVSGQTYTNNITVNGGQTLTLQNPTTTTSAATFSGVLAGNGIISLPNTGTNGQQGILDFTNTGNTFIGDVVLSASGSGDEHFRFASIGDGGTFTFAKNGNRQLISHNGSSNITFNTRTITVAASMVNGNITDRQGMDGSATGPVSSFANNGTGTVTFTQNMVIGAMAAGNYGVLGFAGSNTGDNTFSGVIADPAGTAKLAIGKYDAGKWVLSGANSYEAMAIIARGTLEVPVITTAATAQPLGINQAFQLGRGGDSGTLSYTGGTSSTDKQVFVGSPINANTGAGGGSILNNGTGALTFTNTTFNPFSTTYIKPSDGTVAGTAVTATRTLTLGGSYTAGTNEIQGIIQDNVASTGKVSLTVSGSVWQLSGANTFSGNTTVQSSGTLKLNYSAGDTNKIAGILTLGAGGTLELIGGNYPESVTSTTLSSSSALPTTIVQTGGGSILQMGAITRNAGAFIVFAGSGIATTDTLNNPFGILGTWATVNNGNDWAVNSTNLANGPITAPVYTDVPRLNGASQVIADNGASQVRIIEGTGTAADITLAAATTTIATLTQSTTGGASVSMIDPAGQTLAVGAILAQNGAGSLTIGNGTNNGSVQALSAGGDLTVNTVGGSTVTLNSTILDNATSTLTKMGTGTLVLTGSNTYAGVTTILNNGGTLRITNPAALGTGAVTISTAGTNTGTLELALTSTNSITNTFNGFSSANNLGSGNAQILNTSGDNTITSNLTITNTGGNGLNVASNGGLLTLSGTITHTVASTRTLTLGGSGDGLVSGPITAGSSTFALTKTGSGTWTLAGANTYVGTTTIAGGTLKFGASDVIPDPNAVVIGSAATAGTLDINGFSEQLGNGPATAVLTLGSSSAIVGGLVNQVINSGSGSAVLSVDGGVSFNAGPAGFYNGKALISANIQMGVSPGVTRNFTVFDSLDAPVDLEVTGVVSGTNIVGKEGAGALFLNNDANTFTGQFILNNGKLQVTKLADANSPSSIGTGAGSSVVRLGDTQNPTLEYVGTTDSSTNRKIQIGTTSGGGTGATILNNGAGKLTFSEPTVFNNTNAATIARTLILGGGNTLDNTISGAIVNNTGIGGNISVTKQDAGKWILSGSNTYTGATTINGGTLVITGATQATSAIIFGGGVLGLDIASPVTAAGASVNFTGQSVLVTGSPTLSSYTLLTASSITGTPTLATPVPGYTLVADGTTLKLNATGGSNNYASWAISQGIPGAPASGDYDKDGMSNLVEYALGKDPKVSNQPAGVISGNTITFTKGADAIANGDVSWAIETSTDVGLTDAWTVAVSQPAGNTSPTISHTFTPSTPVKDFARLKVTQLP